MSTLPIIARVAGIVITALAALWVDTLVSLGVAAGLLYLGVMIQAYSFRRRDRVLMVAMLCSALVVVGYLISRNGSEGWQVLANRGLTLFAIWIVARLILARQQERQVDRVGRKSVMEHELELEETVAKLTESRTEQDKRARALISITEDLRAERAQLAAEVEQRLRAEARFRATVEAAPTAMVMADASGRIVLVNGEAEKMFGYERGELLSLCVEDLLPQRFRQRHPELRREFARESSARRMGQGRELFACRKDGSEFPVEIGLNPVNTDEGNFTLSAIIDISERKEAESKLQQVLEDLGRSNAELEQFAYVASHDLQEPLRMVSSYLDLIVRRYNDRLDDAGREFIGYAVDGAKRMRTMIEDLLRYSRVGTQPAPSESVDTGEILRRVLQNLKVAIEESGATVHQEDLPVVVGVPIQLEHLFQNLIGNALKFRGEENPVVRIGAVRREGQWEFHVADNGIGIERHFADRIFQVFQRLHTREAYPGTGIGLALCKKIVERHGGQIWLNPEPGAGTGAEFMFTLPATTIGAPP